MILVTGATGTNGKYILEELAALGAKTRALVRNMDKAGGLKATEVVEGDFVDGASLAAALKGVDAALLLAPPTADAVALEHNFIEAAKTARLPRLVKFSAIGADPASPVRFLREHGTSENEVRASGIPFTFLQPNQFMQNLLGFAASIQHGSFYAPVADAKMSMVDVRDIAAVAAHVLTEAGHEGKSYLITGPAAITYTEAAEVFSRVLGTTVRFVDVAEDVARQQMLAAGIPEYVVGGVLELDAMYREGKAAMVTDVVEKAGHRKPRSFEDFVRDYAAAFKA